MLVTGNRWGKSYAEAVKIIHHALFRIRPRIYDYSARYHIVTASITLDQARIIFNAVIRLLGQSPPMRNLIKKSVVTPYPRITLGNGAVIEARSTQRRGEYLLGHDYDFFVYDEVAFDKEAEYVVNEIIRMRLADRHGRLDLVSTPNGRNWLYHKMLEMKNQGAAAYIQFGDTRENMYISEKYLKKQIKNLSDRRVAQNIQGQFVDSGGEIIPGRHVDRALIDNTPAASDRQGTTGTYFLTGWDLARKKTATVGITVEFCRDTATVIALERIKNWDWNIIIERIHNRQKRFPGRLVVDATGLGDVVASQLGSLKPQTFIFTGKSKAELLTNLELFHALNKI